MVERDRLVLRGLRGFHLLPLLPHPASYFFCVPALREGEGGTERWERAGSQRRTARLPSAGELCHVLIKTSLSFKMTMMRCLVPGREAQVETGARRFLLCSASLRNWKRCSRRRWAGRTRLAASRQPSTGKGRKRRRSRCTANTAGARARGLADHMTLPSATRTCCDARRRKRKKSTTPLPAWWISFCPF